MKRESNKEAGQAGVAPSAAHLVRLAPGARTNGNDMERINDVEQPLFVLDDNIMPADEHEFGMRHRELLAIRGPNNQRAPSNQLLADKLSIHAILIAPSWKPVKCAANRNLMSRGSRSCWRRAGGPRPQRPRTHGRVRNFQSRSCDRTCCARGSGARPSRHCSNDFGIHRLMSGHYANT